MKADLLGVVEAAYDLDADDGQWMQGLVDTVGPLIDAGYGAYGGTIDASGTRLRVGKDVRRHAGQSLFVKAVRQTTSRLPSELIARTYRHGMGICTATEVMGAEGWDRYGRPYGPPEVADCIALIAADVDGVGCMVISPLPRVTSFDGRTRRVWARIVAHITAMQRLRGALSTDTDRLGEGEAVLTPGGKLEHAVGLAKMKSARERLREAAIARERARGRLRRQSPEEATAMWHALVAGRWSIVDRFDRGGRRYLIAHANEPHAREPRTLTARERHVVTYAAMGHSNKLIAYELGLSVGTVSAYLARATRKLGLDSRLDVVRLCRASWMGRSD
jgi:DNA-binding CsgD family transcriptional regulator